MTATTRKIEVNEYEESVLYSALNIAIEALKKATKTMKPGRDKNLTDWNLARIKILQERFNQGA